MDCRTDFRVGEAELLYVLVYQLLCETNCKSWWHVLITKDTRCEPLFHPPCSNTMCDIIADVPIYWIFYPRYLKFPLLWRTWVPILTSTSAACDASLGLHSMYSVLVMLNLKPLNSNIYLQTSNLSLTPHRVLKL